MIYKIKMISDDKNALEACFQGILTVAYGVNPIETATEWQIDAIKECVSRLKEAEIDHMLVSIAEKQQMKRQWKLRVEAYAQGFKDELKRRGRLV